MSDYISRDRIHDFFSNLPDEEREKQIQQLLSNYPIEVRRRPAIPTLDAYDGKCPLIAQEPYSKMKIRTTYWMHWKKYRGNTVQYECTAEMVQYIYSRMIENKKGPYFSDERCVFEDGQWIKKTGGPRFAIRKFNESILKGETLKCNLVIQGDPNSGKSIEMAFCAWVAMFIENRAPIIGTYGINAVDSRRDIEDSIDTVNNMVKDILIQNGHTDPEEHALYTLEVRHALKQGKKCGWDWGRDNRLTCAQVLLVTLHHTHLERLDVDCNTNLERFIRVYGDDPIMPGQAPVVFYKDEDDQLARSFTNDLTNEDVKSIPLTEKRLNPVEDKVAYCVGVSASPMPLIVNNYTDRKTCVLISDRDAKYAHMDGVDEYKVEVFNQKEPFKHNSLLSQMYWEELLANGKKYDVGLSYSIVVDRAKKGHTKLPGVGHFTIKMRNETPVIQPPKKKRDHPEVWKEVERVKKLHKAKLKDPKWKQETFVRSDLDNVVEMTNDMVKSMTQTNNRATAALSSPASNPSIGHFRMAFVGSDGIHHIDKQLAFVDTILNVQSVNQTLLSASTYLCAMGYHSQTKDEPMLTIKFQPPIPKKIMDCPLGLNDENQVTKFTNMEETVPCFTVLMYIRHLGGSILTDDKDDCRELYIPTKTPMTSILTIPDLLIRTGTNIAWLIVTCKYGGRATNYRNCMHKSFCEGADILHKAHAYELYITHIYLSFDNTGDKRKGNNAMRIQLNRGLNLITALRFGQVHHYGPTSSNITLFESMRSDHKALFANEGKLLSNVEWKKVSTTPVLRKRSKEQVPLSNGSHHRTKKNCLTQNLVIYDAQQRRDQLRQSEDIDMNDAEPIFQESAEVETKKHNPVWGVDDCETSSWLPIDENLEDTLTDLIPKFPGTKNYYHILVEDIKKGPVSKKTGDFWKKYHSLYPDTSPARVFWIRNDENAVRLRWLKPECCFRGLVLWNPPAPRLNESMKTDERNKTQRTLLARTLLRLAKQDGRGKFVERDIINYMTEHFKWSDCKTGKDQTLGGSWSGRHLVHFICNRQDSRGPSVYWLRPEMFDACKDICRESFTLHTPK